MTILANQTVVWKHNGEFAEKVHVIMQLEEDGTFHVIQTRVDGLEQLEPNKTKTTNGTNT